MKAFLFILSIIFTSNLFSQTAEDYYNKGLEQKRLGDPGKAFEYFDKSFETDPKFYLSIFEIGKIYIEARSYDLASETFTKVIQIEPGFSDAYIERGNIYVLSKMHDQGCKDFAKAKKLGNKTAQKYIDQYCK
jgi:tetratricopeptide (TPR) repeat protein